MGYHRAGFDEIVGVDIVPQPNYPFEFIQGDALEYPLDGFDLIHASPPCQVYSATRTFASVGDHPDLVGPTRKRLESSKTPWVIENVPGAPIRQDVVLCGSMFGLPLRRHRWFETSDLPLMLVPPCMHRYNGKVYIVAGHPGGTRNGVPVGTADEWRKAMEVPWMTAWEISQAIPPAYTEWIGQQIRTQIPQP